MVKHFDILKSNKFAPKVWIDAGTQVFYSYCATFGGMVALGSYNKYRRNFVRDCTIIATVNCFSSLFAGCVIFSVLGFMSESSGIPVSNVVQSGNFNHYRLNT